MRRRPILLSLAILTAVMAALIAIHSARSDTPQGGNVVQVPTIVRDKSGDPSLAIELGMGRSDTGRFDFHVGGKGVYEGTIPVTEENDHVEHVSGTVPVTYSPDDGSRSSSTTLRMEGVIDSTDSSATVETWIDGTHYSLVTEHGNAQDGARVARQAIELIAARNWQGIYPMLASEVQQGYTQAQFVQAMMSQDHQAPDVISMAVNGDGQVVENTGYTYYQQPITAQVRLADGSTKTFSSNLYLVLEGGAWRYMSTDTMPTS